LANEIVDTLEAAESALAREREAREKAELERDVARGTVGAVTDGSAEWQARAEAAEARLREVERERDALRAEVERLRGRLASVLDSGIALSVAGGHRASEAAFREERAALRGEGER
jgi:chromosome segregation ATPase